MAGDNPIEETENQAEEYREQVSATNWIADLETIIRHLNTVKKSQGQDEERTKTEGDKRDGSNNEKV
jgi:hypothetical protein